MSDKFRIIGIIQARMDSRRFPCKMTARLCGQPLLQFIIRRAQQISGLNTLVVATTARSEDDIIAAMAVECKAEVYRGSLEDVAGRLLGCARQYRGDYFIRLNGDSPCLDAALVAEGIGYCPEGYDIITNIPPRTYPYGISVEIMKTDTFAKCYPDMTVADREHSTRHFYNNPDKFRLKEIINPEPLHIETRFTVDYPDDLERLNEFLKDDQSRSWREAK